MFIRLASHYNEDNSWFFGLQKGEDGNVACFQMLEIVQADYYIEVNFGFNQILDWLVITMKTKCGFLGYERERTAMSLVCSWWGMRRLEVNMGWDSAQLLPNIRLASHYNKNSRLIFGLRKGQHGNVGWLFVVVGDRGRWQCCLFVVVG